MKKERKGTSRQETRREEVKRKLKEGEQPRKDEKQSKQESK